MKTLVIALLMLAGCASEWKCPNAPKLVATFSVGEHVAYTRGWTIWSARSNPQSFWVNKGDTGIITDIVYFDTVIRYEVVLDKAGRNELLIANAYEGMVANTKCHDLEAVVYPDPALAPK